MHIDDVVFYPWRGPDYYDSIFKIRILVLGESTYLTDEQEQYDQDIKNWGKCYFVEHDVKAYRDRQWTARFWTNWTNCLYGRRTDHFSQRRNVLDSVAFWNYADGEPLDGNRTYPRPADLA